MPKRVSVAGVGTVNFPDSMSDADIQAAIETDILPKMKANVGTSAAAPTVPSAEMPVPEPGMSVGGFVSNVGASGVKLAKDIGSVLAHPVRTVAAVKDVAVGGLEKARQAVPIPDPTGKPLRTESIPKFDAFVNAMKERYGGLDKIKRTAYEDPVGFLVDVSSVLTGGATAAGKAGLTTTAKVLAKAGAVTDPIAGAAKVVGSVVPVVAEKVVAPILGKTTGTGTEAVLAGAKGSKEFEQGLRGAIDHEDIVGDVRKAVGDLADSRQSEYQAALTKLPQTVVTTKPLLAELRTQISNFGGRVKAIKDAKGNVRYEVDFSGPTSKITDPQEVAAIQSVVDDVAKNAAGGSTDMLTLDAMKQRIGQRIGAGSRADKVLTATRDAARNVLDQSVPGYKEMTKDYAEASALLDKLTTEFSTKGGAAKTGASIRKLTNALNQRNEFRKTLIEVIDNELGTNIKGALAGAEMSSLAPRGIMGPLSGAGAVAALSNPSLLAGLALASPRFVGEMLVAISKARKAKLGSKLPQSPAVPAAGARAAATAVESGGGGGF